MCVRNGKEQTRLPHDKRISTSVFGSDVDLWNNDENASTLLWRYPPRTLNIGRIKPRPVWTLNKSLLSFGLSKTRPICVQHIVGKMKCFYNVHLEPHLAFKINKFISLYLILPIAIHVYIYIYIYIYICTAS
jgi:hypothetical protein